MSRITIGRDSQRDIRIDENWDTVSNCHGEICYKDGQLTFTDYSSNGTVINGQKIQNTTVGIQPGDTIRLANAFVLEWTVIEKFFPEMKRPTVVRNIRGENQNVGRRTIEMKTDTSKQGRKTEQFNQDSKQHQPQQSSYNNVDYGQANEYSQSEIDKEIERWNWGAFFCGCMWSIFNGIYWPLFVILVAGIPYIGQVCSLSLSVFLGLNGSKMAWRTGKFQDFERFKKTQRNWAIGGIIWFVLSIIGYAYILDYTLTIL